MPSKSVLISVCVSLSSLTLIGCGSAQQRTQSPAQVSNEQIVADRVTMRVDGLGCPMCAESIAILLKDIPGVTGSRVDLAQGMVDVDLDGQTPVDSGALRAAIDNGGFTYRSMTVQP